MPIPFVKYSGCGNDFIIIDNRERRLCFSRPEIVKLCHRHKGVGADGVILLESHPLQSIPYQMRIFNSDGSEAEMCGNGVRCLAQHIRSIDSIEDPFVIKTMHQQVGISFHGDLVTVGMPSPAGISFKKLTIDSQEYPLHCLDTGVPHAVLFRTEPIPDSLLAIAPAIRFAPQFPKGTNVNFAHLLPDHTIAVRTYERGVEQETLACGTGAAAVALSAAHCFGLPSPITIHTRSGDLLYVGFQQENSNHFTNVTLTGPAVKVFEGLIRS